VANKRIRTTGQAKALRAGVLHGREDAFTMEATGRDSYLHYFILGDGHKASVTLDGKPTTVGFDLFAHAWSRSYIKAFDSRFHGLSKAAAERKLKHLRFERDVAAGRIKKVKVQTQAGRSFMAYTDGRAV
jgi:hypothetical protein